MESPVNVLLFGELLEGLAISLLLLHPATDQLLRSDLIEKRLALFHFDIGDAEDVSGAGESIIFIFHKYKVTWFLVNCKLFFAQSQVGDSAKTMRKASS